METREPRSVIMCGGAEGLLWLSFVTIRGGSDDRHPRTCMFAQLQLFRSINRVNSP